MDSFAQALVALAAPLRRRAQRLTRDTVQAEDLAQETLTKAWSARASFTPGTNLQAWTYTILRNLFLTQRRRARPTVEIDDHIADRLIATEAGQHEQVELGLVLAAIERLPAGQRSALRAVTLEGLDYGTAAERLDLTLAALKSRVNRARTALATLVDNGPSMRKTAKAARPEPVPIPVPVPVRGIWSTAKSQGRTLWIG